MEERLSAPPKVGQVEMTKLTEELIWEKPGQWTAQQKKTHTKTTKLTED